MLDQQGGQFAMQMAQPVGHAVEVKTALTFPEGRKAVCTVCGTAWLELDALRGRSDQTTPSS